MKHASKIAALAAVLFLLVGCAPSGAPGEADAAAGGGVPMTLVPGLTAEALCDVTSSVLAPEALPGVTVQDAPEDHDVVHWCISSGDDQLVRVSVNYGLFDVEGATSGFEVLVGDPEDPASNPQCPNGSSMPEVTAGLPDEVSMLCDRDDKSLFEYTGASPDGSLAIRVERAPDDGPISVEEAQSWVTATAHGLLADATHYEEASADEGTSVASGDNSAAGVCEGYLAAIDGGSDPSVLASEWLEPSDFTQPLGIGVPTPDCVLQVEQNGGVVAYNLGWTDTDFFDVHDALIAGGLKDYTPWEGENGQRKFMMTWEDETGLFWLDSGDGITAGTPVDDVLFVYAE